jgi:hypothetical protein
MLRNPDAKLIDFSDLVGLIESNPKFLPSDLDMIYERNGKFLVVEWKKPDEALTINSGQEILLKALASNPAFTVLKVIGYTENAKMYVQKIDRLKRDGIWQYLGDGLPKFKEIIQKWYSHVSQ